MHPPDEDSLKRRVVTAAEAAHLQAWKKGRVDSLEGTIQANPSKVSRAISLFGEWAVAKGLRPSETRYARSGLDGTVDLRFTESGDAGIETRYRTHYVSPALSEHKQQKLERKLSAPAPPVVFQILRDSACSECGVEIGRGDLLLMEAERPLCLACARLNDLEFLPRGDAAVMRRATKYSGRNAVVVRFSRSRGRYERQGILVEVPALQRAEQECSLDAEDRARSRALGAQRRTKEDGAQVVRMTEHIAARFPGCPPKEAAAIAAHTAVRGSGRVGRSEAGRNLAEGALTAAVAAAIRHRHTNYDELLLSGVDRLLARELVSARVREVLKDWSG